MMIEKLKNIFSWNKSSDSKIKEYNLALMYAIIGILYMAISSIVFVVIDISMVYSFIPVYLVIVWLFFIMLKKNISLIKIFLGSFSIRRGVLYYYIDRMTAYSFDHKRKFVYWVYPSRNQVRNEETLDIRNKLMNGESISLLERKTVKKKTVFCPQQMMDGVNKLIIVDLLIYAHRNISALDSKILDIFKLTPERMSGFDYAEEVNRLKTRESRREYDRLVSIGKKNMEKDKN